MRFVSEAGFRPVWGAVWGAVWGRAVAVVGGGTLATLVAGLLFALRPLAVRPARVLRARE